MRRKKLNRPTSKRLFRQGAARVHPKNNAPAPMRGGYRL